MNKSKKYCLKVDFRELRQKKEKKLEERRSKPSQKEVSGEASFRMSPHHFIFPYSQTHHYLPFFLHQKTILTLVSTSYF